MKPFTKTESLAIGTILLIIFFLTFLNLRISLRRARDSQRRADIGSVADALEKYQKDFGFFPPSTADGKILACKGDNFGQVPDDIKEEEKKDFFFKMLKGCGWGKDALRDVNDDEYEEYMKVIPSDPKYEKGYTYLYISNMNRFQLFAYLEGEDAEVGFRQGIIDRGLECGINTCNYGKAFGVTPLEKTLEEYENELIFNKQ